MYVCTIEAQPTVRQCHMGLNHGMDDGSNTKNIYTWQGCLRTMNASGDTFGRNNYPFGHACLKHHFPVSVAGPNAKTAEL